MHIYSVTLQYTVLANYGNALVSSSLEYCDSILFSISNIESNFGQFQEVHHYNHSGYLLSELSV